MSDSRPKKISASSSQNANRPLYGHGGMSHPGFVSDDRTLLSDRVTARFDALSGRPTQRRRHMLVYAVLAEIP